ncbi:MAG: hypothetical protein HYT65_01225 [Candidatus Yanofskybacteria bacterium]|nr:hypothetical protein [Candidatus Yanofskybacteria bacterium]
MKNEKFKEMHDKLATEGAELLVKTLPDYLAGGIKPQPQDHAQATFTKKFTSDDGEIKTGDTPEQAYNKIRALNPEPGTFFLINRGGKKLRLKIIDARLLNHLEINHLEAEPLSGGFSIKNGHLALNLKDGYIILETVQPEGKHPMTGKDFIRGYFNHQ